MHSLRYRNSFPCHIFPCYFDGLVFFFCCLCCFYTAFCNFFAINYAYLKKTGIIIIHI